MAALAGRLLCDTYLSARELVREVDYTLKTLAQNLLGQARAEVATVDVPGRYDSAAGLRELLLLGESDAWLALGLAFQLSGNASEFSGEALTGATAVILLLAVSNAWLTLVPINYQMVGCSYGLISASWDVSCSTCQVQ
eukprot:GHRR01031766.1.p1 GENE.GHRR01031766.1~~GHRR01031766.1.p1  ORF type:complete len:139 (+),score=42.75 GHRR01031766.1:126-542(+)